LRELARTCSLVADGQEDLVARYGGDELVLLLPDRSRDDAVGVGEQLRRQVELVAMEHPASAIAPHVTVSVGVATTVPTPSCSPDRLIAAADLALYAAKAGRRNKVVVHEVGAATGNGHWLP